MLQLISRRMTGALLNRQIIEENDTELYQYGFELLFSTAFCVLAILGYSLIFSDILGGVFFLLFFMPLRCYAGGFHAPTYGLCFLCSSVCFFIVMALAVATPSDYYAPLSVIILFFSDVYIFFSVPAENKYRKLSEKKKIKYRKNARVILCADTAILLLGIFLLPIFTEEYYIASLAMGMTSILMLLQPRKEVPLR